MHKNGQASTSGLVVPQDSLYSVASLFRTKEFDVAPGLELVHDELVVAVMLLTVVEVTVGRS